MAGDESDQKCGQWLVTKVTAFLLIIVMVVVVVKIFANAVTFITTTTMATAVRRPRLCSWLVEKSRHFRH
jgi:hypothetical protein